jgi:hypothetical protein
VSEKLAHERRDPDLHNLRPWKSRCLNFLKLFHEVRLNSGRVGNGGDCRGRGEEQRRLRVRAHCSESVSEFLSGVRGRLGRGGSRNESGALGRAARGDVRARPKKRYDGDCRGRGRREGRAGLGGTGKYEIWAEGRATDEGEGEAERVSEEADEARGEGEGGRTRGETRGDLGDAGGGCRGHIRRVESAAKEMRSDSLGVMRKLKACAKEVSNRHTDRHPRLAGQRQERRGKASY